jgi:hypothetical protein
MMDSNSLRRKRLERLARLVTGSQDNTACAECRKQLPDYVETESAGQDAAELYPQVRQHLETCLECQQLYAEQLDIARLEATDALPQLAQTPHFDLSFLPRPKLDLAHLVYESTEAMLRAARSVHLDELVIIRDTVIERLNDLASQLGQLGPLKTPALVLGFTEPIPAAQWATATLIALQAVRARSSVEEIEGLKASGELIRFLSSFAKEAAKQAGLEGQEQNRFADAFARTHAEERWSELVEWMAHNPVLPFLTGDNSR